MPKLPVLSGLAVIKILEANEFKRIRQKGSHVSMQKIIGGVQYNVVVPLHSELARGTMASIIRQSGLPREQFFS
jgi:predicted RNA binding protein YcfA (HicA-like mRNA interferase family)